MKQLRLAISLLHFKFEPILLYYSGISISASQARLPGVDSVSSLFFAAVKYASILHDKIELP